MNDVVLKGYQTIRGWSGLSLWDNRPDAETQFRTCPLYADGSDNQRNHGPLLATIDGEQVELSQDESNQYRASVKAEIRALEQLLRGTRESTAAPKIKPLANAIRYVLAA